MQIRIKVMRRATHELIVGGAPDPIQHPGVLVLCLAGRPFLATAR